MSMLFLNVLSGLHLVVNPLYLHSCRHLSIADFDMHTFMSILHLSCCEGVVFPPRKGSEYLLLLWSSRTFDFAELASEFIVLKHKPH